MKFGYVAILILIMIACHNPEKKERVPQPVHTTFPDGAIRANFLGNQDSLYAYVNRIDSAKHLTYIDFEDGKLPGITIPQSQGAQLKAIKFSNIPGDILLINAKPTDTNFNEYYLFVWEDSLWKQPVNRFDIHKSNMNDTLIPIILDPQDSTRALRYYSVFDMDQKSEQKYSWKLMRESVDLEK